MVTLVALAIAALWLGAREPGPSAGQGAGMTGYSATFVAVSSDPRAPGLTVYSAATGKALRRLTHDDRDGQPSLSADGRRVYFAHAGPSGGCSTELWRVPLAGGPAREVSSAGEPGDQIAVSADGRRLAYVAAPGGPCDPRAGATTVVVVNLKNGRRHTISGEVTGLAWSPDDSTLAVVSLTPPTATGRIRLISDPFRANRVTAGLLLPCPTRTQCDAQSPSFDRRGDLFYVATIPPRAGNYCWFGVCFGWTYALTSVAGSKTRVLASVVRRDAEATTATVNEAGTAIIFTLPAESGYPRVWRWSGDQPVAITAAGAFSAEPAW